MSTSEAILCVFLRAPNLGQVKTRLAAEIGDAAALAGHIRLVEHLLGQLGLAGPGTAGTSDIGPFSVELWLADSPATAAAEALVNHWTQRTGQPLQHQQGDDLGQRMDHALASCCERAKAALLVGADCPTIDRGYVLQAMQALDTGADVVLGPAEDGGYGLVGLTQQQPRLFANIDWGSRRVLEQTLAAATEASLRVAQLNTLWDVDYLEDWERFCASCENPQRPDA